MSENAQSEHAAASHDEPGDVVLGVFRAMFGLVVLYSLADLVPFAFEHFSDDGWMPRSAYLADHARFARFSVMDAFGRPWHVVVYFVVTVLASLSLAVGYRTRLATVATFLLVTGMHERNTFPFDGSDNVIRVMLFWLMFVDSGRAVSVDARLRGSEARPPQRPWPVWLLERQPALVYLCATVFKLCGASWQAGTAARNGFLVPHTFSREWSVFLGDVPWVVMTATYGTIVAEGLLGLALLAPRRWVRVKWLGVAIGVGFHLSTVLFMNVGNFPIVMATTYLLHVPADKLERLRTFVERRLVEPGLSAVRALRLGPSAALPFTLPTKVFVARDAGLALLFVSIVWNGLPKDSVPWMPRTPVFITRTVQTFEVWQQWDMFAPYPIINDYVVSSTGTLVDGTAVDPLEEAPGGAIARSEGSFPYRRWTKAMNSVAWGSRSLLLPFGRYVCKRWNPRGRRPDALATFDLIRRDFPVGELGQPRPADTTTVIWQHRCFD